MNFIDKVLDYVKRLVERTNYWWNIAGVFGVPILVALLANQVIAIVWSILLIFLFILPFLGKKAQKLCYSIRSFRIPDNSIPGSNQNLTLTGIAIWNAGTRRIEKQTSQRDKPEGELIIKIEECEIEGEPVVLDRIASRELKCEVKDKSQLILDFVDYLDPNEGVSLQIIHTGCVNSKIEFKSLFAKEVVLKEEPYSKSRTSISNLQRVRTAFAGAIIATLVSVLLFVSINWQVQNQSLPWKRVLGTILYTFFGNFSLGLWLAESLIFGRKEKIPANFEHFHNQSS